MIRSAHAGILGVILMTSACAKRGAPAEDAPGTQTDSPAAQCLADAAAPRTPNPNAPSKIGLSHILIRHKDLERPEGATRTREEACLLALEALDVAQQSGDWDAALQKYSDSGKSTGGYLGLVALEELESPVGNAAFALEVDQLSYVVESNRGFHILLRTE